MTLRNARAAAAATMAGLGLLAAILGAVARVEPPTRAAGKEAARGAGSRRLDDLRQLARAIAEAHANCEAARDLELGPGAPRPVLVSSEAELAVTGNPLLRGAVTETELASFLLGVRFVRDLGAALMGGPDPARERLLAERLTAEDARFLLGAIHVRLDRALARAYPVPGELEELGLAPAHPGGADGYRAERLVEFRGLSIDGAFEAFEGRSSK